MLSQKSRYALRALAVLAEHEGPAPLSIPEISARADAPRKFLEAILLELRRQGVLKSARGKFGGYTLAAPAAQIELSRVIRVLDGPLAPIPCASLTAYSPCQDCPQPDKCATRRVMREVRDAIAGVLETRSVADLIAPALPRKRSAKSPARQRR